MTISLLTRFRVFKRDRFTCVYCGAHPPNIQIEVDHFFPVSQGGRDDIGNLVTSCWDCNHGKGTILFDDDALPEPDSLLWRWIILGQERENQRLSASIAEVLKNHIDHGYETLADAVYALFPDPD